jgi:LysR family hydrogen peroxide-inducible transcriptional activator
MELHQLRYFVAVAETGGFCKAAGACRVAQPSLSQQIRRLEESMGVRLLDRLGRRTVLTDAGRELLPRARRILAEVREAEQGAADAGRAGRLAIGVIPTIAPFVLPAIVKRMSKERPGCELVIREDYTERVLEAVIDAELDVCLVATPPDDGALAAEPLGTDPFVLAVPRDDRLARRRSVALNELEGEPFIVLHEVHCLGRQVGELCRSRRVRACVVSTMTQLGTAVALVEAGMGVTIIPRLCLPATRGRRIATVPIRGAGAARVVSAVWRRDRTRPAAGAVLRSAMAGLLIS